MSEWQPIETAPKDGTIILIWDRDWPIAARWIVRVDDWVSVPHNALLSHAFGLPEWWAPMMNRPPRIVHPANLDLASTETANG